jgi:hypothetical protein
VSPVTLKLYDPTGALETTVVHAPRLDTLAGKTICELSNIAWEHQRIFPAVREEMKKRFPTLKIIPYTEVIDRRMDLENLENVTRVLKELKPDAVIAGMAA